MSQGIATVILLAIFGIAAAILLHVGRGQVLLGDALEYASRLGGQSFGQAVFEAPANKYLIAVPLLVFDAMFHLFGLGADLPYRILTTAVVLLCGYLFFLLSRRRVGFFAALAPTVVLLLFGSGWESVLTVIRLPSLIAVASGLGGLLALERCGARSNLAAASLLAVSVASHPNGFAYVAAAAVIVALREPGARRASVWLLTPAIFVIAVFVLFLRSPSSPTLFTTGPLDVVEFAWHAWTSLVADVSGFALFTADPSYDQAVNQVVAVALIALILLTVVKRRDVIPPRTWGLLLALAITLCAARLSPGGALRPPDEPRYLYPEGVLLLLVLVDLVSVVEGRRWLMAPAAAILMLGLVNNLDSLRSGGSQARASSAAALGEYTAYELAGRRADPSYGISGFETTPEQYRQATAAFGSLGLAPEELSQASATTRQAFDKDLVGSLRLALEPGPLAASGGPPPLPTHVISGRARTSGACLEVTPPSTPAAGAAAPHLPSRPTPTANRALALALQGRTPSIPAVPQLVEIETNDSLVFSGGSHPPGIQIGREFAPPAIQPLHRTNGPRSALRLPRLHGGDWHVLVGSSEPLRVCTAP